MLLLNENALLLCQHVVGRVQIAASQSLVRAAGGRVLVRPDPQGRAIAGCPNAAPGQKACLNTLPVLEGYSTFVRIEGRAVCLDSVTGLTDGVPPGLFRYQVKNAGQRLVRCAA
jgi:hypothetical protein